MGLACAYLGSRVLVALMSSGRSPIRLDVSPNLAILGFTGVVSVVTAVLFGLAPAFRATRVDVMPVLRDAVGSGPGRLRLGVAKALVVSEIALSLLLLATAGLFGRTLVNLKALDVGFDTENVLLFGIDATQAGYQGARLADYYERVQQRVAALPGVISATMSFHPLLSGSSSSTSLKVAGAAAGGTEAGVRVLAVGPRFLETMRIPLWLGRDLDARDHERAPLVAVVNQTLARRFFGSESPVGGRFGLGRTATGTEIEIVGVVRDARYNNLRGDMPAVVYIPVRQRAGGGGRMTFEVRAAGDAKALIPSVRRAVAELDARLPLSGVKTQAEQVDELLLQERLFADLTGFFGLLALALVCVGLYGILSYAVAKRTGEIGIRMALGAQRTDILSMVLRETLLLVLIGVGVGVPAALAAGRLASGLISGLLFGLGPTDVVTIAAAALVMTAVAVTAGLLPARRASRVDPMVALRYE